MSDGRLLIFHPSNNVCSKLATGLKGIGYQLASANDVKGMKLAVAEFKPHIVLWGAALNETAKKVITELKNHAETPLSLIAISDDPNLRLNDRIEAYHCGVGDFISLKDNLVELKSKILFQKAALEENEKTYREKLRLEKLSDTNYNLILSQGLENLFETALDHIETTYPFNFLIFTIFNNTNSDFDFFSIITKPIQKKIKEEQFRDEALWRDYLLTSSNLQAGELKNSDLLNHLKNSGINAQAMYHFPMVYKGTLLGRLLLVSEDKTGVKDYDVESLQAFTQVLAHRVREVRRFYGLEKQTAKEAQESQHYFKRPSEDEIIQMLGLKFNKLLQADLCMYLNYNEGFRFLSPKFMFLGESTENLFDAQKPPVLMLDDFPSFEALMASKSYKIVDLVNDENAAEFKKIPGINKRPIANLVVFQLLIGKKVRGFLLLGRESIVKKYLRSELQSSEKLINAASEALEESEILKQAKLTVKQLERIFDLGTELTLDSSIDTILRKICTAIRRTLGWNVVIMDMKNPYDDNYRMISLLGLKDADYQNLIKNKTHPPFVERVEKSLPISNSYFYDHALKPDSADVQIIGEWNDKDWVYVPISSRGKQLGMISLNDPVERRKPTAERIRSIEYFANQAAVVIENTELFERLRSSELRYRLLAETMTMGLVTCESSGDIIYVNNSLVRTLSYEIKDELLDKNIKTLCTETTRARLEKHIENTLSDDRKPEDQGEEVIGQEIELLDNNGEILPFMIYTSPYYQQDQRVGFFAVLADLRNQKKIERMRADFNSMIVHDLRSPLNIIQGYVDIVRTGVVGEVSEEQIELLTIAKENVFKLLKLIDSFLTASKLEAGHLTIERETSSLNSLIETIFEQSQVLVKEKKLTFEKNLDEHIPLMSFDKFRMEQVIRNYISNAIKFTPLEGKITITSKLLKRKNEKIKDFDLFVQVAVEDTGVGISDDELGKVFNKYEQTEAGKDASLKGTGLGLAICQEIVELHSGEVWVKSKLHDGSTFGFTLPIEQIDV